MSTRDPGDRRLLDRRYRLGRITAVRPLGRIFQARHIGLDAVVALTELRAPAETPPEAHQRARTRFFARARRLTALSHPGLPRVHDYFYYGDACILVSDYVEGETLAARIQRTGPVPVRTALGYALHLCDVLAYLHQQQPPFTMPWLNAENVRITQEERAVPVDLGLARHFEQALRGDALPSPRPQEDVVAIGLLLSHMLQGERMPPGLDTQTVQNMGPRTPETIRAVIVRALDQHASNAISSVADMGDALQAAAHALFGPLRPALAEDRGEVGASLVVTAPFEQPTAGTETRPGAEPTLVAHHGQQSDALSESAWQPGFVGPLAGYQAGTEHLPVYTMPRRRRALMGLGAASVALAATLAVVLAAGMPSGHNGNAQPRQGGVSSPSTIHYTVTPGPKSADGQLAGTPPSANPPVRQQIQPPTPTTVPPTATTVPAPSPTTTPLLTPTPTASPTPGTTPTPAVTPAPSATPAVTPSPTPAATPTATPATTPSASPTATPIPTSTPTPADTPTPLPSPSPPPPTPTATATPAPTPVAVPTPTPAKMPPEPQGPAHIATAAYRLHAPTRRAHRLNMRQATSLPAS